MAYVENATVHDADSHVMELPGTINDYIEASYRERFMAVTRHGTEVEAWVHDAVEQQGDAAFRAAAPDNILLRKNYQAMGSFLNQDRPAALDLLGFTSQLVFTTTALSNYGLEYGSDPDLAIACARAHNRMMADFCAVDKRLLATGYVPLIDLSRAADVAREALQLGCKGLVIASRCPATHSPSHVALDSLWALAQEAGVPILFHVGGEEKMAPAYFENGLPRVKDFHGGDENFTSASFMTIPVALWQTMSMLILDGVCDRFPQLKFGAIELGASWLPSWMRFLDAGFDAFRKGETRLQNLSARPSEIAQLQFRVTPYPHEDTDWIIKNSSDDMCLFSSDFPHIEGGRNPLKRFNDALAGASLETRGKFYRDNFIDLMGQGLEKGLHDHPSLRISEKSNP